MQYLKRKRQDECTTEDSTMVMDMKSYVLSAEFHENLSSKTSTQELLDFGKKYQSKLNNSRLFGCGSRKQHDCVWTRFANHVINIAHVRDLVDTLLLEFFQFLLQTGMVNNENKDCKHAHLEISQKMYISLARFGWKSLILNVLRKYPCMFPLSVAAIEHFSGIEDFKDTIEIFSTLTEVEKIKMCAETLMLKMFPVIAQVAKTAEDIFLFVNIFDDGEFEMDLFGTINNNSIPCWYPLDGLTTSSKNTHLFYALREYFEYKRTQKQNFVVTFLCSEVSPFLLPLTNIITQYLDRPIDFST